MTIVDDLVSVDDLIDERLTVEPINEYVQSCDIVAFNKICEFFYIGSFFLVLYFMFSSSTERLKTMNITFNCQFCYYHIK